MNTRVTKNEFETVYKDTYNMVLKYSVIKCRDIDNVNDIVQDTYVEFLSKLNKNKGLELENVDSYILGICNNVIKRHYFKSKKTNVISLTNYIDDEESNIDIKSDIDIEANFITDNNVKQVWNYLKNKDLTITKIFYLYYSMDEKISNIAKELNLTESNVKNKIYRTLKEMKNNLGEDVSYYG